MIKLSLTPDLRFANDELIKRRAKIAYYNQDAFTGTFSILQTGSSSQVAITAQAPVYGDFPIDSPENVTVELKANIIKDVYFKKGDKLSDTGIEIDQTEQFHTANAGYVTNYIHDLNSNKITLGIERTDTSVSENVAIELTDVVVARGGIVGNTTGFIIRGAKPGEPELTRIHALCNWVDDYGFNKNLESFKMVTKDHNAIVLTLGTK